jgi:hypothetical protein
VNGARCLFSNDGDQHSGFTRGVCGLCVGRGGGWSIRVGFFKDPKGHWQSGKVLALTLRTEDQFNYHESERVEVCEDAQACFRGVGLAFIFL